MYNLFQRPFRPADVVHMFKLYLPGSAGAHHAFCADVSNSGSVSELVQNVRAAFNHLPTVAVNSAGITKDAMMLKMSEEMYDKVLNVNLKVR